MSKKKLLLIAATIVAIGAIGVGYIALSNGPEEGEHVAAPQKPQKPDLKEKKVDREALLAELASPSCDIVPEGSNFVAEDILCQLAEAKVR